MSLFTKIATVGVLSATTLASHAQKGGKSAKALEGTQRSEIALYAAQTVATPGQGNGLTVVGEYTNGNYVFGGGLIQAPGCSSRALEYAGRKFFERKVGSRLKFDFGATMGLAEEKKYYGATIGVFFNGGYQVSKHLSVKGKVNVSNAERGLWGGVAYTFGGHGHHLNN